MSELANSAPTTRDTLQRLLNGYTVSQAIIVAAQLGIADLLADGPQDCAVIAESTEADAPSLYRMMRLLASVGVFAEDDQHRFALTPLAEWLRTDVEGSLQSMALLFGDEWSWRAWGGLLYSVRTGRPAFDHLYGMGHFAHMAQHREVGSAFDAMMVQQTTHAAQAIVAAYDFAGVGTVVDVGGGRGALLATILSAHPTLRGILFDQPSVLEGAGSLLEARGVAERCALVGGDFFQAVPEGGDIYILQQILHDWDDERARRLLSCCRAVLPPDGRLLIVERLIPPGNTPSPAKVVDVRMLVMLGGRERSEAEYADLLAGAGLRLARVLPTQSHYAILEARRASSPGIEA